MEMDLVMPTNSRPGSNPVSLWKIQLDLMKCAEDILGPRDKSKIIYQPIFADDGPYIRNTPNLDGAFAELSRNAEGYWPTVVKELAHETVHLLNPRPGIGNWLSEGIAESFSDYAQRHYGMEPQKANMESYSRAKQLVSELSPDALTAGRRIRDTCMSLNNATQDTLVTLFPTVNISTLKELCKQFDRDWSG